MDESIEFEQILVQLLVVNCYHFEHLQVVPFDETQPFSLHCVVEGSEISSHTGEPLVPEVMLLLIYTGRAQL